MSFSYEIILIVIASYLLGSVPFGLVLARLGGMGDIREIGSGNIGATNVLRTGRKDLALATLLLDAGKGAIAVFLTLYAFNDTEMAAAAGMAAFIGHCFPVYLGFKGGKGVATFFGTLFAIDWQLGLAASAVWLLTALLSRMSSLGGLLTALFAPLYSFADTGGNQWLFLSCMTVVIFIRHRDNISRIMDGTETKIGADNKKKTDNDIQKTE